uniref:Uncharacterized protein n=1 Tax=Pavo cristatus TaxID=9049 RepID=A0A8C9GDI6_PAVCR
MWRSCGAGVRAVVAHGLGRAPPTALCSVSLQDLAVPNAGWSAAMHEQYQHLLHRAADGSWRRIPSYRRGLDYLPGDHDCPLCCVTHAVSQGVAGGGDSGRDSDGDGAAAVPAQRGCRGRWL